MYFFQMSCARGVIRFVVVPVLAGSLHRPVIPDQNSTTLSENDYLRTVHAKMTAMSGVRLAAICCPAEVSVHDTRMQAFHRILG